MTGTKQETNNTLHLRLDFKYFPAYAKFLLDNHLEEFVKDQLAISRQVKIPLLKYFENLPEEELLKLSTEGIIELLSAIATGEVENFITTALERWVNNSLPIVEKEQVLAEDITLVSYIRKKSLVKFLTRYTSDQDVFISIIDEADQFLTKYEFLCFNIYHKMQQDKINSHLHFIEKINQTVPGILFVYNVKEKQEVFSNRKAESILGFYPGSQEYEIHPDDLDTLDLHLESLDNVPDNEIRQIEFRIKNKSGDYVWMRSYQTVFSRTREGKTKEIIGISFDITSEKEITQRLKQNEEQLLEAQELTLTGSYVWDMENNLSEVTPQVNAIFGLKPGTRFNEFMQHVHPEDQDKVKKAIQEALTNSGKFECEYRYIVNDEIKIISSRGLIQYVDGKPALMKGTVSDVTDHYKLLKQLEESDTLFKQAQALTHIGNWSWNMENNEVSWSDELYRIYDLEPQSEVLTYERFIQFIHPDDRDMVIQQIEKSLKNKSANDFHHRIITVKGKTKVLHAKGEVKTDNNGKPLRMVGTGQDVTEEYKMQQQLRELNDNLELKNRELERSNKELSSFSYVASHDLQEPLRKIKTFGNRLLESNYNNLNETGKDSLNRMTSAAVRMQKLIEDLLAYSRTHTEDFKKEEVDLNLILKDLESNYKDIYPEMKVEQTKLPVISGMKFQLLQLFDNLMNNAVKYRKEDLPLEIKISYTPIKGSEISNLGADENLNYYHISFGDNGIGFESQYEEKVFELFQRLQGHNNYPGTGIGLSICKRIVENHDGFITARSIPGTGTTFHIYLPASKTRSRHNIL